MRKVYFNYDRHKEYFGFPLKYIVTESLLMHHTR